MSTNNDKPLMSIEEFCNELDIGKNVAYQLLNSHTIDAFRIGRVWKIPRENVKEFIKKQAANKAEVPVIPNQNIPWSIKGIRTKSKNN